MIGPRARPAAMAVLALGVGVLRASIVRAEDPSAPPPPTEPKVTAPNEPPAVPNPGPEILGGRPKSREQRLPPVRWRWGHETIADYVIGGTAGAVALAAAIVPPLPVHHLEGGILFDDAVRNAIRPSSIQVRYAFRDASNVELSLAATWPVFADSLTSAWWYHGDRDTAQAMAVLDLETLAIAGAVQGVTNVLVSRPRPYASSCGTPELPAAAFDCGANTEYRSFFSGHATFTFTAAALVCLNHSDTDLLGSPWDALTCGGGYLLATTTSVFRLLADLHYSSDVITGALVGTAIGYGVPFLHRHLGSAKGGTALQLVPSRNGLGLVGSF
jgi:membrane-associated phospholipid phosphatase